MAVAMAMAMAMARDFILAVVTMKGEIGREDHPARS
jgi:hypothetical protein